MLIRSAHSSNIKERRDASTALFDPDGEMVMQAEHIPVHLGAMPAAVAAVLDEDHSPGVSWILNDPFAGGTHLPDITVITPDLRGGRGSERPAARLRRQPRAPRRRGRARARVDARRQPHPRGGGRRDLAPPDGRADDRGARGAHAPAGRAPRRPARPARREPNRRAALASSSPTASAPTGCARPPTRCSTTPSAAPAPAWPRCPDGALFAEDVLEAPEGDLCCACARVAGERLILDFAGSAPQHEGNLNCPLAVTRSACLFAVRVLTDPDIPPSAGAYRPIEVRAPEGSVLNARPGAAVAAGNVETSSRVADLVLAAFGRALGQGTMNNLTLGDSRFSYYETLGGGQGACAGRRRPERRSRRDEQHAEHRPSRRSSANSRCTSSNMPCAAGAEARGFTAAATASCVRSRRFGR